MKSMGKGRNEDGKLLKALGDWAGDRVRVALKKQDRGSLVGRWGGKKENWEIGKEARAPSAISPSTGFSPMRARVAARKKAERDPYVMLSFACTNYYHYCTIAR